MKSFKDYILEKKVAKKSPEVAEAQSLLRQAQARLHDLHSLSLDPQNAPFRFESGYEVLREALQAFLAKEGFKPYSHEAVFCFGFERGLLSEAEYFKADRFRRIRNDINYRGKLVTVEEARELLVFIDTVVPKLEHQFQDKTILSSPNIKVP
ncbi:hypothetical protein HYX14_00825 [Candidatus Woesearchaeota archaeon]|nr:hypothetical protein [Candidatus Woesearchaeota archaeon]